VIGGELRRLWHKIQVGRAESELIGQRAKPMVVEDSGGEDRGRTDWSACSANGR
jgi:hypothetical protein